MKNFTLKKHLLTFSLDLDPDPELDPDLNSYSVHLANIEAQ
jgi:hypothetical protein